MRFHETFQMASCFHGDIWSSPPRTAQNFQTIFSEGPHNIFFQPEKKHVFYFFNFPDCMEMKNTT